MKCHIINRFNESLDPMILERSLIGFLQHNSTGLCLIIIFDYVDNHMFDYVDNHFLEIPGSEIFSSPSLLNPRSVLPFALKHFKSNISKQSVSSLFTSLFVGLAVNVLGTVLFSSQAEAWLADNSGVR